MILEFYNTFGWISKPLPFRKRKRIMDPSGNPEKRKEQVIKKTMPKKLKRSLLLLLYLFHWRTLIWYVQWPYYEIRYWIKHRSRNKDEDSLQVNQKSDSGSSMNSG